MMDEMSDNSAAATAKAEKLREKGVGLTVIGTDQTEVEAMATPGSSFIITDYSNLPSVEAVVDSFCRGKMFLSTSVLFLFVPLQPDFKG